MSPYDVITMGRVGVDIYPLEVGVPLDRVERFGKFLGGSATNVAVAAARYGLRTAVITRTGADPFGSFVHRALREFGVSDAFVSAVDDGTPTPVTFCEIFPPDDFPVYFYRGSHPPDLRIHPGELDLEAIAAARVLWITATGLSQEPSRSAHHLAVEHAGRVILDLDYRPTLWSSLDEARAQVRDILPRASVAVGNLDEVEVATGLRDPVKAARTLLAEGVTLAVIKLGQDGVLGVTATETVRADPVSVQVVNGLGAGDAFGGALCRGLLAGLPLAETLRFANAAGAIVASRLACSSAMPTEDEVTALL